MIRIVVKYIFIIGIIFGSGMLLSAVVKLVGYNEVINVFEFDSIEAKKYDIKPDPTRKKSLDILYSYEVQGESYEKKLDVSKQYFKKKFTFGSDSTLTISYNTDFPHLSYIPSLRLEQRKEKVGLVISSIFLAFISVIYFFGNVNKSAQNYEELGKRPWIYPPDENEENPVKRFFGRFFRKQAN